MEIVLPDVRDVMSSPVVTIVEDEPVGEALRLMRDRTIRRLPVVGSDGRLVGIITREEARIAAGVSGEEASDPVHSEMTTPVHTVRAGDLLDRAITLMALHDVGALPVVEGVKVVGIVTDSDVFRWFAAQIRQDGQASWQ